jgi:hypothetical protein
MAASSAGSSVDCSWAARISDVTNRLWGLRRARVASNRSRLNRSMSWEYTEDPNQVVEVVQRLTPNVFLELLERPEVL